MATMKADDDCVGDAATNSSTKRNQNGLGDWMGNLPTHLLDVPLQTLSIPGSHNSGTYELKKEWEVGPDADQVVKNLSFLPMAKDIIHSWSRCQNLTIMQQLKAGVRYMDLRVAHRTGTEELHLIHGLYGPTVAICLEEVKTFLEEHDKEVVLLDFNHFYNMELEHHLQLITYLLFVFDGLLSPYSSLKALTLSSLREKRTRVVVFYAHSSVLEFTDLWPPHNIKSVWSKTMNIDECLSHQEAAAKERCGEMFHVCQVVLTPGNADVMQKFASNLCVECAQKINPRASQWMNSDGLKGYQGMVFSADFVEEGNFIQSVVNLNK